MVPDIGGCNARIVDLGGKDQINLSLQKMFLQLVIGCLLIELEAHVHPVRL